MFLPVARPGVKGDWAEVGRGGQAGVEQSGRGHIEDTFGKSGAGVVKVFFVTSIILGIRIWQKRHINYDNLKLKQIVHKSLWEGLKKYIFVIHIL